MSFDEHPVPYHAFCYPSQGRHLIFLRFCLFLCLLLKTILESISSVMEHFKQLCAEMPLKIKWQSQRPTALARKIKEPAQHPSPATITIMHCKERGWCSTLCALNWNHLMDQKSCLAICTASLLPSSVWECITGLGRWIINELIKGSHNSISSGPSKGKVRNGIKMELPHARL